MKKMVRRRDDVIGFAFTGESTADGILIRAETLMKSEMDAITKFFCSGYPGAFASVNDDGVIVVTHEDIRKEECKVLKETDKKDIKRIAKLKKAFLIMSILCFILFIPAMVFHEYLGYVCFALSFIFIGLAKVSHVVYFFMLRKFGSERIKRAHRYHSAEHAVINAYYDLNRVPTLEEVKGYSNYSYYCGVGQYFSDAWSWFMIGFCRFFPNPWYFVAIVIMFFVSVYFFKVGFFFTEYFALEEPTDVEYQVAIKAIETACEYKRLVDEAKEIIHMLFGEEYVSFIQKL